MSEPRKQETTGRGKCGRTRYERPAIVSRESLEVIAAVCSPGKGPLQPGDCLLNSTS